MRPHRDDIFGLESNQSGRQFIKENLEGLLRFSANSNFGFNWCQSTNSQNYEKSLGKIAIIFPQSNRQLGSKLSGLKAN